MEFGCRSESFLRLANYENKIYAQCLCHQIKELHLEGCKYLFNNKKIVAEGETLCLGKHTLQFFMVPMVHWPESMVTYEQTNKIDF